MEESLIPPVIPLSSEHLTEDGIYLLENGEDCLIYIANSADPNIMRQLFGISSVDEIPSQVYFVECFFFWVTEVNSNSSIINACFDNMYWAP